MLCVDTSPEYYIVFQGVIAERQRDRETETEGQRDRGTEGQRDRGTEGQRDRGTEGQRDRGTEGQRDRGTERQRDRETERQGDRERSSLERGLTLSNENSNYTNTHTAPSVQNAAARVVMKTTRYDHVTQILEILPGNPCDIVFNIR